MDSRLATLNGQALQPAKPAACSLHSLVWVGMLQGTRLRRACGGLVPSPPHKAYISCELLCKDRGLVAARPWATRCSETTTNKVGAAAPAAPAAAGGSAWAVDGLAPGLHKQHTCTYLSPACKNLRAP